MDTYGSRDAKQMTIEEEYSKRFNSMKYQQGSIQEFEEFMNTDPDQSRFKDTKL